MKRELKNAVSRLRKLQDAALNGKVNNFACVMVQLDSYWRHYESGDYISFNVTIVAYADEENCKRLHWSMDNDGCEIIGSEDVTMTHEEFLQYVSQFLDYPV